MIDLGAPVDVAGVAIDPGAGCGDDPSAGLRDYEVRGSTGPDGEFRPLGLPGAFPGEPAARCGTSPDVSAPRVRYVKLNAKTPQDTTAGGSGAEFLDVAELHVAKTPGSALGPGVDTGARAGRRRDGGRAHRHRHAARRRRAGDVRVRPDDRLRHDRRRPRRSAAARQPGAGRRRGGRPAALEPLPLPRRGAARRPALRGRRRHVRHRRRAAAARRRHRRRPWRRRAGCVGSRLKADRKGRFKVRVAFGATRAARQRAADRPDAQGQAARRATTPGPARQDGDREDAAALDGHGAQDDQAGPLQAGQGRAAAARRRRRSRKSHEAHRAER